MISYIDYCKKYSFTDYNISENKYYYYTEHTHDQVVCYFLITNKLQAIEENNSLNFKIHGSHYHILFKEIKNNDNLLNILKNVLKIKMKYIVLESIKNKRFDMIKKEFYEYQLTDGFKKKLEHVAVRYSNLQIYQHVCTKHTKEHLIYATKNLDSQFIKFLLQKNIKPTSAVFEELLFYDLTNDNVASLLTLIKIKIKKCLKKLFSVKKIKQELFIDFVNSSKILQEPEIYELILKNTIVDDTYSIFKIIKNNTYLLNLTMKYLKPSFNYFDELYLMIDLSETTIDFSYIIDKAIVNNYLGELYGLFNLSTVLSNDFLNNLEHFLFDNQVFPNTNFFSLIKNKNFDLFIRIIHNFKITIDNFEQQKILEFLISSRTDFDKQYVSLLINTNIFEPKIILPLLCKKNSFDNFDLLKQQLHNINNLNQKCIDICIIKLVNQANDEGLVLFAEKKFKPSSEIIYEFDNNFHQKLLLDIFPELKILNEKIYLDNELCVIMKIPIEENEYFYKCMNNHYYSEEAWIDYGKIKKENVCCICSNKILNIKFINCKL